MLFNMPMTPFFLQTFFWLEKKIKLRKWLECNRLSCLQTESNSILYLVDGIIAFIMDIMD